MCSVFAWFCEDVRSTTSLEGECRRLSLVGKSDRDRPSEIPHTRAITRHLMRGAIALNLDTFRWLHPCCSWGRTRHGR